MIDLVSLTETYRTSINSRHRQQASVSLWQSVFFSEKRPCVYTVHVTQTNTKSVLNFNLCILCTTLEVCVVMIEEFSV